MLSQIVLASILVAITVAIQALFMSFGFHGFKSIEEHRSSILMRWPALATASAVPGNPEILIGMTNLDSSVRHLGASRDPLNKPTRAALIGLKEFRGPGFRQDDEKR